MRKMGGMEQPSKAARDLKALREQAGVSVREAARELDISPSGYKHYEDRFKDEWLPLTLISKLVPLFQRGGVEPARTRALAGLIDEPYAPEAEAPTLRSNVRGFAQAPAVGSWARDLPVYGTAIGGREDHGNVRGAFEFNMGDVVDYIRRPPRLDGVKAAFAVFAVGESMVPRFRPGAPVIVHPGVQPAIGDDVLVELRPLRDGDPHPGLLKRLVSRNDQRLRLEQFNPPDNNIVVMMKRVLRVYRVVPYEELFAF
ncbi:MAG TPA: helix-turn-helix domain-containing protein [Alphaproteobacteria bacterium]